MLVVHKRNGVHIDLDRCGYCRKLPRGKLRKAQAAIYDPYCSYQCQERAKLAAARAYLDDLYATGQATPPPARPAGECVCGCGSIGGCSLGTYEIQNSSTK